MHVTGRRQTLQVSKQASPLAYRQQREPNLTRPWSCSWYWAPTPSGAITLSAAPPHFHTAPGSLCASPCLQRATAQRRRGLQVSCLCDGMPGSCALWVQLHASRKPALFQFSLKVAPAVCSPSLLQAQRSWVQTN